MAVLEGLLKGQLASRRAVARPRLGTSAAALALTATCLYVILSPLSPVLQLGVSDRGGFGAWLVDLIWLSLAVSVVGHAWQLRAPGRHGRHALPAESGCAVQAHVVAKPDQLVGALASKSHRRRVPVLETVGFLAVLGVYHGVFLPGAITWGDWSYYLNAGAVRRFFPLPSLWSFGELGNQNILGLPLAPVEELMGLMARLGVSYSAIERVLFYFPVVALPYLGTVLLLRFIGTKPLPSVLGGLLFATNTYALQMIAGGQVTVGMGYALAPWVALAALWLHRRAGLARGCLVGLLVGVQAWYDPREALLSCLAAAVITVVIVAVRGRAPLGATRVRDLLAGAVVLGITQLHWVLVALLAVQPALPGGYTSLSSLHALSYMSLGDGLTIFHPFWPFFEAPARIHTVPAVWFVVPIGASLALLRKPVSLKAMSAGATYLVFAVLVSGDEPPFAPLNSWLFTLPGLDVFRDPSPYFGPAALAAAVLIAIGVDWSTMMRDPTLPHRRVIGHEAHSDQQSGDVAVRSVAGAMVVGVFAVGCFPALSGRLGDNLAPRTVPRDAIALARYVKAEGDGTVLWLPYTSRFAAQRPGNPTVSGWALAQTTGVFFPSSGSPFSWLAYPDLVQRVLQRYGIRYVVIDSNMSAYESLSVPYRETLGMERAPFASFRHRSFGQLALYEVPSAPRALFSLVSAHQVVVREPGAFQGQLSGFLVSVAPSGGAAGTAAVTQAFPNELGPGEPYRLAGTTSPAGSGHLSVAEPLERYSVVQAELRGATLVLRDVPTLSRAIQGGRALAAAPSIPWQTVGALSRTEARRGVVIEVEGAMHYLSGSSLARGRPVPVASVPTSSALLSVSVESLGRNLLGVQSFAGGLDGWGLLGNENDWQYFRLLSSAGISARAGGACGAGAMTLRARLDAAGINHTVPQAGGVPLVVGAELRSLAGSAPVLNGFFRNGQKVQFVTTTTSGPWASLTSIARGGLSGLQFVAFQGERGASVACLKDPYVREAVPLRSALLHVNTVIANLARGAPGSARPVRYQSPAGLSGRLQLLATTSFRGGLGQWGSLGDVDNYNHDTLHQAGISAGVSHLDVAPALHLTVDSGAAGISQPYISWASSHVYRLTVTYMTTAGASLTANLFPRQGRPAAQSVAFPSSSDHWATKTVEVYVPATASAPATVPGALQLVLWPGGSGKAQSAYIRYVALQQVVPHPVIVETPSQLRNSHGHGFVTPAWASSGGADSFTISVAPRSGTNLLVFWQSYSTGWKAVDSTGQVLTHVEVNGWANGFLVRGTGSSSSRIRLVYQPQKWEVVGLLLQLGTVLTVGTLVLSLFICRRLAHRLGTRSRPAS